MTKERNDQGHVPHRGPRAMARMRNYFLTGLIVAGPVGITLYLTWSLIEWVDGWVKPFIPTIYNPETYLPFAIPGLGLLVSFLGLVVLGFLTAGLAGKTILSYGELMLDRMPVVRNVYRGLKQIFETVLSQRGRSFQKAALVEYPRRGLWAIVFLATDTVGEVMEKLPQSRDGYISVFLPTTPNPTSGFLLFVPRKDIIPLDMGVEDAAKLVISAGLVNPDQDEEGEADGETTPGSDAPASGPSVKDTADADRPSDPQDRPLQDQTALKNHPEIREKIPS